MAANTDKFRKSVPYFSTTLAVGIGNTDTTISLQSTTNVPTDTAVTCLIDYHDASGNTITPSTKREVVIGVVSGTTLITCLRGQDQTTAQAHSVGSVVEFVPTASDWNALIAGILVAHNQDGTQANNSVTTAAIQDSAVTTAKIASEAWTSYTPTWTASTTNPVIGNGSLRGAYVKLGRTVHYRVHVVLGSTTTLGSGTYSFSLPFATTNTGTITDSFTGTGDYFGPSSVYGPLIPHIGISSSTFAVVAGSSFLSNTNPYTWISGSQFHMSGTYESAS